MSTPSKKSLIEKIHAVNEDAVVEGLNGPELQELLKAVTAAKEAADSGALEGAAPEEVTAAKSYTVAEGHSFVVGRKCLKANDPVTPEDFPSEDVFDLHVKAKRINEPS